MSKLSPLCLLLIVMISAGCATTRSISDSGYREGWQENSDFGAELSEFDIIGVSGEEQVTEGQLSALSGPTEPMVIKKGSPVILIQSGALLPDDPMQRELDKFLKVAPFSGRATSKGLGQSSFSKSLRLAALKGGYNYIICYWGVLEAQQKELATKAASWTPIVGKFVPDETQEMRIRLKMLVMDVRTGRWTMFASEPVADSTFSARLTREQKDQGQVALLKEKGYTELAAQLSKHVVE